MKYSPQQLQRRATMSRFGCVPSIVTRAWPQTVHLSMVLAGYEKNPTAAFALKRLGKPFASASVRITARAWVAVFPQVYLT